MELTQVLDKLIEIKDAIKQLKDLEKKYMEEIQDKIEEKIEHNGWNITPSYTTYYKIKDDIDVNDIINKGYTEAIKIDAKKLYEIGDENIKKSIEKENKKSIRFTKKRK